jgi:hypothetical protein
LCRKKGLEKLSMREEEEEKEEFCETVAMEEISEEL